MSIQEVFERQSGVVRRAQLLALGVSPNDIRRLLRQRRLVTIHPGVYVNHTGGLTWTSRAWAAVLGSWPAALADRSAVEMAGEPIHVAVDPRRNPVQRQGVRLHRLDDLEHRVLWNLSPPRVRFEDALISVAASATSRTSALSVLSDACRRRRTTPERLAAELAQRVNVKHRAWLLAAVAEVAGGVQSALESAYLNRVERAHGLPRGQRQHTGQVDRGVVYRDVLYTAYRMVVELDGRIGHELDSQRWNDMDRDIDSAVDDLLTIRLGWRHAEHQPCRTAQKLGQLFQRRGWLGALRLCGRTCRVTPTIDVTR